MQRHIKEIEITPPESTAVHSHSFLSQAFIVKDPVFEIDVGFVLVFPLIIFEKNIARKYK